MLSFGIEAASGHQNMSVILSIMENSRRLKRHCIAFVKDAVHVFQCFARLRCDEPMRYTHIGIHDQAKAVANLPNPCQHIVSIPGDFEGQTLTLPVMERQHNDEVGVDAKPCGSSLCDTDKQKESAGDSPDDSWRRGELNPRPVAPQPKPLRA